MSHKRFMTYRCPKCKVGFVKIEDKEYGVK